MHPKNTNMKAPSLTPQRWWLATIVCCLLSQTVIGQVNVDLSPPAADRILVKPRSGADLTSLHASLGTRVLREYPAIQNLQVVQLPPLADQRLLLGLYERSGLVDYAEPDFVLHAILSPNDPHFANGNLWALHNTGQNGGRADADIDAPEAWNLTTDAAAIVIAVIDTGVRHTHEDLAANLWVNPGENGTDFLGLNKRSNLQDDDGNGYVDDAYGIDAITGSGLPWDDHGHGTHVAGTIGAVGNNGRGVVGVAWQARIMHLRFLNAAGQGTASDAIECIDYARRKGAKVISASWGGYDFNSNALRDAIASTRDAGMLFVAATGNDANNNDYRPLYPASYDLDNIIAVAATTRTDELASFSNFGATTVDLGAPGVDILSARNTADNAYTYMSGTSMATPHVAGASALVWARYPGESHVQVKNRVLAGTDPLPALAGKSVAGGRLNLQKAIGSTTPSPTVPVVTVSASDPSATESGDTGAFTVTRTGNASSPLSVRISWGGNAGNGTDYQSLPATLTLPVGASTLNVIVQPIDDDRKEGSERVTLTLRPASAYTIGSPGSATVTITDNDTALLPPLLGGLANANSDPALSPLLVLGDGQTTQIRLEGVPSGSYVLEASSDLVQWTPVATNRADAVGDLLLADSQTGDFAQRFYRARRHAQNLLGAPYRMDRVLVKPKPGVALADLSALNATLGVTTLATFPEIGNLQVVNTPTLLTASSLIVLYRESGLVQYAEHDHIVHALLEPNDARYQDGSLWNLHNTGQSDGVADADIDAPEAWASVTDAGDVVVAVIDSGIRHTHQDLAPNLWLNPGEIPGNGTDDDGNGFVDDVHGISTLDGSGDPMDDNGHGSHVAGTIGAAGNNQVGMAGVCWQVQLMALRFLDAQGEGSISDAITCINYAIANGAAVINASWGSTAFESQALRDAIASARDNDVLFVAASGNSRGNNDEDPLYPASYDLENIIAVAATTRADSLAVFSNFGARSVDLAAPGSPILSTWNNSDSDYQYLDGTSMAAAHVSGLAALLKADQPGANFAQLKERILNGVDPLPALAGRCVTGGRLNAAQSLAGDSDEPVVTLSEFDPNAAETGPKAGIIRFHRTGDPSQPIEVNWTFSGTAQNGADFQELPTTSPFPTGLSEADLTITPIDDTVVEEPETVVVTLVDGPGYRVGTANTATVVIADNDGAQPAIPILTVTASDANASEAGDTGTFTISRTGGTSSALNVSYSMGGGAGNGTDYQALSGSASIAAGSSSTTVVVTPLADSETEGSETVALTLSASPAYTVGSPSSATVTIADGGEPPAEPVITLIELDPEASETGPEPGVVRFRRTGDPAQAVQVNWTFSGTAQNGADFQELPTTSPFPAGLSEADLTVTPTDDSLVEGSETVIVTLVDGPGYTVGTPSTATITIADNDEVAPPLPTVTVTASDANAAEPGTTGTFTISRTGSTAAALPVNYALNGTADNGTDYETLSGSVTISSGSSSTSITLTPIDDSSVEGNETAILTLTANPAYSVGSPGSATVTLADNDEEPPPPLPTVTVAATDANAAEPSNTGTFTVSRTGSTAASLTVNYAMNGSAQNGADYQGLSGSVTISAGSSSAGVTLSPIDDTAVENNETAILRILENPAYSVGSPSSATVAIADNDEPPPPPLPAVTVAATDAGAGEPANTGTFTVSRTGGTSSSLTVNYSLNGSAQNGTDYQNLSGTVTIASGASSAGIVVTPIDDSVDENNETVVLTLSSSSAYTVGSPSSATVTIADNDEPPPPLVADFTASPLIGLVPLIVDFTDRSTGSPTSWTWNFGDGSTSTARNPTHTYLLPGDYTVTLTVRNSAGNTSSKNMVIKATILSLPLGNATESPP